jgi:hypothetical protein
LADDAASLVRHGCPVATGGGDEAAVAFSQLHEQLAAGDAGRHLLRRSHLQQALAIVAGIADEAGRRRRHRSATGKRHRRPAVTGEEELPLGAAAVGDAEHLLEPRLEFTGDRLPIRVGEDCIAGLDEAAANALQHLGQTRQLAVDEPQTVGRDALIARVLSADLLRLCDFQRPRRGHRIISRAQQPAPAGQLLLQPEELVLPALDPVCAGCVKLAGTDAHPVLLPRSLRFRQTRKMVSNHRPHAAHPTRLCATPWSICDANDPRCPGWCRTGR